jgi:hypothetical protein
MRQQHNQPYWITYDSLAGTVRVKPFIDISDEEEEQKKHLYPPKKSAYLNEPYLFESVVKQINELVQNVWLLD